MDFQDPSPNAGEQIPTVTLTLPTEASVHLPTIAKIRITEIVHSAKPNLKLLEMLLRTSLLIMAGLKTLFMSLYMPLVNFGCILMGIPKPSPKTIWI